MKKIPRTTAVILVSVMLAACSGGGNTADNTVSCTKASKDILAISYDKEAL